MFKRKDVEDIGGRDFFDVPLEVKQEDISEDGSFTGYGSLFNKVPDSYGDIIKPGAFSGTLSRGGRNQTGIPMLWQHMRDKIPGVWSSLSEDKKGLKAAGQLAIRTTLGNDVYEVMKLGAELKTFRLGLSIGYDTIRYSMDEKKKIRSIEELELWELSLVTFPAKLGANVVTVKTIEEAIEKASNERELEKALRESGVSRTVAQYIVKLKKESLRESEESKAKAGLLAICNSLKELNQSIENLSRH